MDSLNGYSHSGQPNGFGTRSEVDVSRPEPLRTNPNNSKAEKFEDEKRRIMTSCFAKRDETGKLAQSYITHVRVEEDAAYQSSPPPPGSNPQYKKPRVIILAVKSNGRVSMHKARENDDGTFQIGKSWGLEELQSIESFSNTLPKTPQQQEQADWAGSVGFIINMVKPYYWQAKSAKEKEFFIGSLVKIYNKFTGGRLPQLLGFDQKDYDSIIASTKSSVTTSSRQAPSQSSQTSDPRTLTSTQSNYPSGQSTLFPPDRPGTSSSGQGSVNSADHNATSPYRSLNGPNSTNGPRSYQAFQQSRSPMSGDSTFRSPSASRNGTPQLNTRSSYDTNLRQASPAPQFIPGRFNSPAPTHTSRLISQPSQSSISESSSFTAPQNPTASPRRTSDRTSNNRHDPVLHSAGVPGATSQPIVSNSTTDRWRPAESDDSRPTTDSRRTTTESLGSASARSRQGVGEAQANGTPLQMLPERRRPPLQDSYGESNRTLRDDGPNSSQRMRTAATPSLEAPISNDRPLTPTMPHVPGAFDSPAATPEIHHVKNIQDPTPLSPLKPRQDRAIETSGTEKAESLEEMDGSSQQFRPGLGPMMGKKIDVANRFRKAAMAHKAFVPRAGGAGDRLLAKTNKGNEPDGVTGVVLPTRSLARDTNQDDQIPQLPQPTTVEVSESKNEEKQVSPAPLTVPEAKQNDQIEPPVETSKRSEAVTKGISPITEVETTQDEIPRPLLIQRPSRLSERTQVKRRPNPFSNALSVLGVDPSLGTDERALAFEDQLNEFGWGRNFLQQKQFDTLQVNLRREVGKIEAGTWLGHSEQGDDRVELFEKSIDKAISAVDEVEGLLTLYSVELSTLVDDVTFIEAQSQGLQVQTANQKLLHSELEDLIETVSISSGQLDSLSLASLDDPTGIDRIEQSLVLLYKALEKIDPASVHRSNPLTATGPVSDHGMRALHERKAQYLGETDAFLQRLKQYADPAFSSAFRKTQDALQRNSISSRNSPSAHDLARAELWRYGPLMLFTKDVNPLWWEDIIKIYQKRAGDVYQVEVNEAIGEWTRRAQKSNSDDQFALFTTQERENESFTTTARKITVKRSATLAKSFRTAAVHKDRTATTRNLESHCAPHEAFANFLHDLIPSITAEQNFVTDFFHISVLDNADFADAVNHERPSERRGTDIYAKRLPEPAGNRGMADKVSKIMEGIFASWSIQSQGLLELAVKQNEFQGIGMMCTLERTRLELEDTNQDYLLRCIIRLQGNINNRFPAFIDSQIKAIDNVKVKTNKRRGLMSFTRRLPNFVNAIENVFPVFDAPTPRSPHSPRSSDVNSHASPHPQPIETRQKVDEAYGKIITTIFRNLDMIAKEGGTLAPSTLSAGADPEDKEKLNHEILLIENMHHIATNLDPAGNSVLQEWRSRAEDSMREHLARYVDAVVRRPLGRLLDFLEAAGGDRARREQVTYGRSAFKKALGGYDAKGCRRDVDALKKRVEKHFTAQEGQAGADEILPAGNSRLITDILDVCKGRFEDVVGRLEIVAREYDPPVDVEISRSDVATVFRR